MLSPAAIASSLASDRSRKNVTHLVELMHRSGIDLRAYLEEIERQPLPVKWYLTWTLSHFVERDPESGVNAQHMLWTCLRSCRHEGMQRDLWRTMTFFDIAEDISGSVYDEAIRVITSHKHPIAVRVHAMNVAYRIASSYPELLSELDLVLEPLKKDERAGIRTRSNRIRKQIAQHKKPKP